MPGRLSSYASFSTSLTIGNDNSDGVWICDLNKHAWMILFLWFLLSFSLDWDDFSNHLKVRQKYSAKSSFN